MTVSTRPYLVRYLDPAYGLRTMRAGTVFTTNGPVVDIVDTRTGQPVTPAGVGR